MKEKSVKWTRETLRIFPDQRASRQGLVAARTRGLGVRGCSSQAAVGSRPPPASSGACVSVREESEGDAK